MPLSRVRDAVARDDQALRVERHIAVTRGVADDIAADMPGFVRARSRCAAAQDLAIGDAHVAPARQWISPRRAGRGTPPTVEVMPVRVTLVGAFADSIDAPPVKTSLVAPRTPISCVPLEDAACLYDNTGGNASGLLVRRRPRRSLFARLWLVVGACPAAHRIALTSRPSEEARGAAARHRPARPAPPATRLRMLRSDGGDDVMTGILRRVRSMWA